MNGTATFNTVSLGLAAFLIAGQHLKLSGVVIDDGGHACFMFADPQAAGIRLEAEFLTGGALVPAAAFHRELRVLRRAIEEKTLARARSSAVIGPKQRLQGLQDEPARNLPGN